MAEVLLTLQLAIMIGFSALAIRTVWSWVREPDRRHGNLSLALGSLALLMLLTPVLGQGSGPGSQVITDITAVMFLITGYGLLMFRDSFVPFRPMAIRLITIAIVLAGVFDIALEVPASPDNTHTAAQTLAVVATVAIWVLCILEPIVTFWTASRGRPAVEKARLRALSIGYLGLLLIVVVGTVAGSYGNAVAISVSVATLATLPILYVAFFPPVWVRRLWRQPEEDQFRHALHDLLLYSPDRATLADRALAWAERLVGGDAAFVIDADRSVLAARGTTRDEAASLAARTDYLKDGKASDRQAPWRAGSTVVVPLDLRPGHGAVVLMSRGLNPMFGDDELARMRQYASSIAAGLDRVTLNEKISSLERAKTDFLNIASHELRGPMTVIKGYLTMLESGALGAISPKAEAVLPLLISKSDEVNWMIEQMIEASRLEEGRLALKRRPSDIVELTTDAIDGVRMLVSDHDLKVDVPEHEIVADVDPDRFQIIVRNLLSNAAKYSPAGTAIRVDVKRDDDRASVSVADQGVGISQADQERLFTRFSRIESSAHVQGTGLGLWLSREIARMNGGDLTVSSEKDQGSTFTLTVPATR
jgi:signal transduction histidine kinase